MTTIFCVRHGETTHNKQEQLQGLTDAPLTQDGLRHAEAIGCLAKKKGVAIIYTSPLGRAKETAQRAGRICGASIAELPALREICYGAWEGKEKEALRTTPAWKDRMAHPFTFIHPGDFKGIPGESYESRIAPMQATLRELTVRHPTETIMLVTHIGILRAIAHIAEHLPGDTAARMPWPHDMFYELEFKRGALTARRNKIE